MIRYNNTGGIETIKCIFNLEESTMSYSLCKSDVMNMEINSLVIELNSMNIRDQIVYSLEVINTCKYEEDVNSYKKYIILGRELKQDKPEITKVKIDNIFINRINDYDTACSIISRILDHVNMI